MDKKYLLACWNVVLKTSDHTIEMIYNNIKNGLRYSPELTLVVLALVEMEG